MTRTTTTTRPPRAGWLLLWACASSPWPAGLGCTSERPVESPKAAAPLHRGPLTDYVPAAGLRWLVLGYPRKLATHESFRDALGLVFDPRRIEAFSASSGVDLRASPSALVAGFDLGTLYMVELPSPSTAQVRRLFEHRLVTGAVVKRPHPELTRIGGIVGRTPETLLTIEPSTVAVSVGDPTPARIAEAFARKRLNRSPSALRGSALATLPDLSARPVSFLVPGPFAESWQGAANGLLDSALAVGAALGPAGAGRARLEIYVSGDFRPDPGAWAARLAETYRSLVGSSTGELLGLRQDRMPVTRGTEDLIALEVELALEPVARGIRAAVSATTSEIFSFPPDQPTE